MAKDYRRRQVRSKSSTPRHLLWMLISFVCGYLTATVFDFTSLSSWINTQLLAQQKPKPKIESSRKARELPKPKFEFYTLLTKDQTAPASSVAQPSTLPAPPAAVVPQTATNPALAGIKPAETKLPATSKVNNKSSYLVQVASFKQRQ